MAEIHKQCTARKWGLITAINRDPETIPAEKAVAFELINAFNIERHLKGEPACFLSRTTLARLTGYSTRTISTAIKGLERKGYFHIKLHGHKSGTNVYIPIWRAAANDEKTKEGEASFTRGGKPTSHRIQEVIQEKQKEGFQEEGGREAAKPSLSDRGKEQAEKIEPPKEARSFQQHFLLPIEGSDDNRRKNALQAAAKRLDREIEKDLDLWGDWMRLGNSTDYQQATVFEMRERGRGIRHIRRAVENARKQREKKFSTLVEDPAALLPNRSAFANDAEQYRHRQAAGGV